ncbi:MAG: hypothetical protein ACUVUC_13570 [Thermoguttaceae bacterium]
MGNRTMPGYQTGPGNRLLSDGTFHYRYDNEGNMVTNMEIAAGTRSEYSSDYRNRLVQVVVKNAGGTVIRQSGYTYDPFAKRIGLSDAKHKRDKTCCNAAPVLRCGPRQRLPP